MINQVRIHLMVKSYGIFSLMALMVGMPCQMACHGGEESHSRFHTWIESIRSVGKEGQGNENASRAFQRLSEASIPAVLPILEGMKGASPLTQNWLRSVVEGIAHQCKQNGEMLPSMQLTEFLLNVSHGPRARAFAFELIQEMDSEVAEVLLRGMLNDPSNELRRQAVEQWIQLGISAQSNEKTFRAMVILRQALEHARDVLQIQKLSDALEKNGHLVDIPALLGFITHWNVIGPFHNLEGDGFDTSFPPENEMELKHSYDGKLGEVRWKSFSTEDRLGMVDINQAYKGYLKEVTAYAHHTFISETARPVQLRLGCKNAWKVWLNGELLFGRDEYHRGAKIDQYVMNAVMKAGRNEILVKLCQNEQLEDWTIEWEFQLRVCDKTGKAIHSHVRQ